jgi:hypothetical protein
MPNEDSELVLGSPFNCNYLETTTVWRTYHSSLHGYWYSLARIHGSVSCLAVVTENMLTEQLASNKLPLWFCYSGFQASCHNIHAKFHENSSIYWKVIGRGQTHGCIDRYDTKNLYFPYGRELKWEERKRPHGLSGSLFWKRKCYFPWDSIRPIRLSRSHFVCLFWSSL